MKPPCKRKSAVIRNLEVSIAEYFRPLDYGEDIKDYGISLDIVNPPPGYEHLFRTTKPRHIDHKVRRDRISGQMMEVNKHFSYFVQFTGDLYWAFFQSTDEESERILAKELYNSLWALESLPKRVKDFDKERFRKDWQHFFISRGLV